MSEKVEKIVEVLKDLPIRDRADLGGELDGLRLREAARAVIAAMREPTSEMKWAAIGASPENKTWGEVDDLRWKAMIDAALGTNKRTT